MKDEQSRAAEALAKLGAYPFRPLTASDRALYLRFQPDAQISCRSFVSVFGYALDEAMLVWPDGETGYLHLIYLDEAREAHAFPPMGAYRAEAFERAVDKGLAMLEALGRPPVFEYAEPRECARFEALGRVRARCETLPEDDDYVYSVEAFSRRVPGLHTRRWQKYFKLKREHEVYAALVGEAELPECRALYEAWCAGRSCAACAFACGKRLALRALEHAREIGARGYLLRVDGRAEALLVAGEMGSDALDVIAFIGAGRVKDESYLMLTELCRNHLGGFRYVNDEEDMGDDRLRAFKRTLCPAFLTPKYSVYCEAKGEG